MRWNGGHVLRSRLEQAGVVVLLALSGRAGAGETPAFYAGNSELYGYLVEAAASHPGLKALHEEWLAALEKVPQARALDDPMLTYKQFVQSDMKEFAVMLEQAFPWFGTLRLRAEKAAAEAEAARWRMYGERNRVFAGVKRSYFEYAFLGEEIRVTEAQVEVVDYVEGLVAAKYGLGMASQEDLLRIQNERDTVADLRAQMLEMRPALAARLNEAIGRPLDDPVPWPQIVALPPDPPVPPLTADWIRLQNPDVKAVDSTIEGRQSEIDLARRMGRPAFRLSLEYERLKDGPSSRGDPYMPSKLMAYYNLGRVATGMMPFDAGEAALGVYDGFIYREPGENVGDDISVSLGVSLPIWRGKTRAAVAEARHSAEAARRDRESVARNLDAVARMAYFGIQDGKRRVTLYEENLIPRAKQAYENLQAAYASGSMEADFLDVLEGIRELLNLELERLRAVRDWQNAAADLELLLGGPWTDAAPALPDAGVTGGAGQADSEMAPLP